MILFQVLVHLYLPLNIQPQETSIFISIRYAVQYSPICFDESLTFIRCAHYNIKTT